MKKFYLSLTLFSAAALAGAQTTAMDFTQDDCNGNAHHLFETLDQGKVVIMEFFMTNCTPCINAGNALKPHFEDLQLAYPGMVEWYHIGFTDSYTCETVATWVTNNNFPSVPFNNGAAMVAYYGGFGMPTIVVVGGTDHAVLFAEVGFSAGDEMEVHDVVVEFFASNVLAEQVNNDLTVNALYNSSTESLTIAWNSSSQKADKIEIFTVSGQLVSSVRNVTGSSYAINVPEIPSGIYIIKVVSEGKTNTQRISIIR